jgi:hypothetical protein
MRLSSRERWLFLGKTGTGKSHRAKELCGKLMRGGQRLVVFDVCDEYSPQGRPDKDVKLGPVRDRVSFDELTRHEEMLDAADLSLCVVPEGDEHEVADQFCILAELVRNTGRVVLVAEEVGYWGEHATRKLNELATMARKDNVPLVLVAQRAMQVPKTSRTQTSTLNSGRQDDPADLDALAAVAGQAFALQVSRLGPFEFRQWRDDDFAAPQLPTQKEHRT